MKRVVLLFAFVLIGLMFCQIAFAVDEINTETVTSDEETVTTPITTTTTSSELEETQITTTEPETTTTTQIPTTTTQLVTDVELPVVTKRQAPVSSTYTTTTTLPTTETTTITTSTSSNQETVTYNFAYVTKDELAVSSLSKKDIEISGRMSENCTYTWKIYATTITDTSKDIVLTITDVSSESGKINSILPNNAKTYFLNFAYSGELPFSSEVSIDGISLPDGKYYFYYFNKANASGEYLQDVEIINGKLTFNISHCSTYFITDIFLSQQKEGYQMDSYTKIMLIVAVAIIVAIILGSIVSRIRTRKNKSKENFEELLEDDFETKKRISNFDELVTDDVSDFYVADEKSNTYRTIAGDVLAFDDSDEPESLDYGYGYKPQIDEDLIYNEYEFDENTKQTIVEQTNSNGLIMENDKNDIAYNDYDYRYGENEDPLHGMVLADLDDDTENMQTPLFDEDLLMDSEKDYITNFKTE